MRNLYLYGPPGSGKTTLGRILAERLSLDFLDVDRLIEDEAGKTISAIFAEEGEIAFRAREKRALEKAAAKGGSVVALGGGALLDPACRTCAEASGVVVCLDCTADELMARVSKTPGTRPLVAGGAEAAAERLRKLLATRQAHYASFTRRLTTVGRSPEELATAAEVLFGAYQITSGDRPSHVMVGAGLIDEVGAWAKLRGLGRRCVVVCDTNTAPRYGARVQAALTAADIAATIATIPAGERTKTILTVQEIWRAFLAAGLGRGDFAVAVGGGVVGDLTGFAAATWMRGIRWVNVPTSLLAMVDASTGGKTGCDLAEGKNLVGAFHSPEIVLADVATLLTLPVREWRCGLAEMAKHTIIGDAEQMGQFGFFDFIKDLADEAVPADFADLDGLAAFVSRSLAVKVRVVREDPREKGVRAKLNLGHTVGHAVETLTDYRVKHGEAVAIGTVEEARLAVRMGLAPADWPDRVAALFAGVGLSTELPESLDFDALRTVMLRDKKKEGDLVRFALPIAPGDVSLVPVTL